MSLSLFLAALLAVACVLVVALPFLRRPVVSPEDDRLDELDPAERRRLELAEERDRALAELKELEFDHRTGKVSDEDYRASVAPLRRRAAEALRAFDAVDVYRPANAADEERQMTTAATRANGSPTAGPPRLSEPMPVPSEPPQPVTVPEPSPVPSEPPMPTPSPEPVPTPSPEPMPEPSPPTPTPLDE